MDKYLPMPRIVVVWQFMAVGPCRLNCQTSDIRTAIVTINYTGYSDLAGEVA